MPLTSDPFQVILISLTAALVAECLAWAFVYRTSSYRRLKEELDRSCKKLEAIKQGSSGGATAAAASSKANKKEKRIEDNMKSSSKEMGSARMKANVFTGICMMLVLNLVTARWAGVVVGKLPFSPPSMLQAITHRGLGGSEATDCSAAFVYTMSFAFFKQNVGKALGFTLSRATNRALTANNPLANLEPAKYQ
ncbi:integral membrane protein DUF106-domain-containing protein [Scenedesmus sp. NREL 46B-D3]|nr:integral membrane protein DUF106-domain-containing protein [Scenedesmus sp. NREL 46B-D3]